MAKLKSIERTWINGVPNHKFNIEMTYDEIQEIFEWGHNMYAGTNIGNPNMALLNELKEILEKNK